MTFDELVAEVYLITNRPDLVAQTASAVKAATLKAHTTDYYSKDIYETGIEFTSSSYTQSLDYVTLISNFRTLKYLRRVTDDTDEKGIFLSILTPEETIDSYGNNKTDVAYVAGRVLEIRSAVAFKYALLGAYVLPIVRTGAYSSWVAEQHPYAIIYEACRVMFKSIGYDEQSATFGRLVLEEYQLLRASGLTDVGY